MENEEYPPRESGPRQKVQLRSFRDKEHTRSYRNKDTRLSYKRRSTKHRRANSTKHNLNSRLVRRSRERYSESLESMVRRERNGEGYSNTVVEEHARKTGC